MLNLLTGPSVLLCVAAVGCYSPLSHKMHIEVRVPLASPLPANSRMALVTEADIQTTNVGPNDGVVVGSYRTYAIDALIRATTRRAIVVTYWPPADPANV